MCSSNVVLPAGLLTTSAMFLKQVFKIYKIFKISK